MSIYNNTGGANWANKTGWIVSVNVCMWYGVKCTYGHVVGLDLQNNNLTGEFKITSGNLNAVTELSLYDNGLTHFSGT